MVSAVRDYGRYSKSGLEIQPLISVHTYVSADRCVCVCVKLNMMHRTLQSTGW